jgi:hypothetical protein
MTTTRFFLKRALWGALLGVASPGRSDSELPAEVCDRPEDCQVIFAADDRDNSWSARLENELHAFLDARAELVVKSVECHKALCRIVATLSGSSVHPWAVAMIEMHSMPWYADFYGDSGSASGPNQSRSLPACGAPTRRERFQSDGFWNAGTRPRTPPTNKCFRAGDAHLQKVSV